MMNDNIISLFLKTESALKDRPCFRFKIKEKWQVLTWTEVKERVEKLATALEKLGVVTGDRVAILSNTRYEWTIADLAILSLGAVTVPIYQSTLPKDIQYLLQHSQAKVLFLENKAQFKKLESVRGELSFLKKLISFEKSNEEGVFAYSKLIQEEKGKPKTSLEERAEAVVLENLATIVYTSGTTGEPKGVMLTHKNISSEVDALSRFFPFSPEHESLIFLPLAHILARAIQFFQLSVGYVQSYAESIDKLLENIQEVRPHFMACVPRIFEKIHSKILGDVHSSGFVKKTIFEWALSVGNQVSHAKQAKDAVPFLTSIQYEVAKRLVFSKLQQKLGGRIEFFISGGAPLASEIAEFFHAAGILILEGYGLTETSAAINCNYPDRYRFGSVGFPMAHVEEKLGSDGEILVRGKQIFTGYYKNEEATREAFTPDGFFKTGDIGEYDDEGYLRITDRKKDLIITAAGKNIAPQPIENLIKTDPLISQVMVHGDRRKFLTALITLNPDEVKKVAKEHHLEVLDYETLLKDQTLISFVRKRIDEKNKQLASYETIKRFALVAKDFTVEGGELTPTLKVKRKVVTERYKEVLDSFYQE